MSLFCKNKKKEGMILVVTSVVVANNFIRRAILEEQSLTPLKLQKLIYFLFKEYLQTNGRELFGERFETWKHGPVVPSVYYEFMSFGKGNITKFAKDSQNHVLVVKEEGAFKEAFDKVWRKYGFFTGEELSDKTHTPGSAWDKAVKKEAPYLDIEDIHDENDL